MFGRNDDNQWKQKYEELRRELRQQESDWGQLESLLQRAVTRVSIAAAGLDPRIEPALERVRNAVRGRIDRRQLDAGLEQLAAVLKQIEAGTARPDSKGAIGTGAVATPGLGDLMIAVLERLQIDEGLRPAFLATIDHLARFPDRLDEIQTRVVDLLNLALRQALIVPDTTEANPATRTTANPAAAASAPRSDRERTVVEAFLRSLALPGSGAERIMAHWEPGGLSAVLSELAQELQGKLRVDAEPAANGADPLRRLLLSLVQRIGDIQGLEEAARHLGQRLEQPVADPEWPAILQSLADALAQVMRTIRAQKAELEAFISQVGQQLGEFEAFVRSSQSDLDSARSGRQRLSTQLGDEMQTIRVNMNQATDITQLKRSVLGSLNKIGAEIQAFRDHEEARINAAEQRNHELIRQIDALQFETRRLREQNDEQREQLMLDPLTKVNSRYAYEKRVIEEFSRWQRYHQPLAYTIWDIDRFKAINDNYGHKAGDKLLQLVARVLARNIRKSDFLARLGGEEFVLLLPGTETREARIIADKLRQRVAETDFHYKDQPRQVTLSCGITGFRQGDTVDTVYQRADAALYRAKNEGRNRCCSD